MSDVKLYQKGELGLGALDLVYAARPDGTGDGKATLRAVAAIVHGENSEHYAPAAHGHDVADIAGFEATSDARIATAVDALGLGYFASGTDAANLTGTISVDRFDGGAGADAGAFLRGDGTWAAPTGAAFRGALVRKAADQTGADYSAAPAIAWDTEAYDTDGFHSTVSNISRLTVPSGVSYVRLTGALRLANVTASTPVSLFFQKNGSLIYDGSTTQQTQVTGSTPALQFCSPVLAVVAGDYFEMHLGCSDTAIDITAGRSYFSIEVVG